MTHIYNSKLTIFGSDNGLTPGRRQAIIWTKDGILSILPKGTNFSDISLESHIISFKKMDLNMSSTKCRSFCLDKTALYNFPSTQTPQGRRLFHSLLVDYFTVYLYRLLAWRCMVLQGTSGASEKTFLTVHISPKCIAANPECIEPVGIPNIEID